MNQLSKLYEVHISKSSKARRRIVPPSGGWSATPLTIADERFEVEHLPVVEIEITQRDLARLEEDLALLKQIQSFFCENPREYHNFSMWQTMDILRRA
jgi:hypothetical protein